MVLQHISCEPPGVFSEVMSEQGVEPVAVELDEFIKSGGSAKCLTLRLDGEEAALWE